MIEIYGHKIAPDPRKDRGLDFFNGDVPLDIRQKPPVDAVIVSHDHYDHLNKFSIQGLMDKADRFIVPLHLGALLVVWGVPRDKIVELGWWQKTRLDQNLMIAAMPAQDFSGRATTDRDTGCG